MVVGYFQVMYPSKQMAAASYSSNLLNPCFILMSLEKIVIRVLLACDSSTQKQLEWLYVLTC